MIQLASKGMIPSILNEAGKRISHEKATNCVWRFFAPPAALDLKMRKRGAFNLSSLSQISTQALTPTSS
jgi:hypothetical protein